MSKEEYLLLASAQYEAIHAIQGSVDFLQLKSIWFELGRQVLAKSICELPTDSRKNKIFTRLVPIRACPKINPVGSLIGAVS